MGLATTERAAIADLFDEVGPDAPTLCEGWHTKDLAAHLVIRERRPDAGIGIVVSALAWRTRAVQDQTATKPFGELVQEVRSGPPLWNPMRLGPVGDLVNALEFLVHHEDVRRAAPTWAPRELSSADQDEAWAKLLGFARGAFKSSPVGVVLRRPDGRTRTVRDGASTVTLTGDPVELVLLAFGRDEHRVRIDGDPTDVTVFLATPRGI